MSLSLQSIFGLTGKTALVTGSSRGIGAAIAKGLSAAGAAVVVHGQRLASTADTCHEIERSGGVVWSLEGDLAKPGEGLRLIEEATKCTGAIDILVINASSQINAKFDKVTADDFEFQWAVNLRSSVEMLQASLPGMAERGWGRVVSIGSINQIRPKSVVSAYAATKAAQHNLINTIAQDYAKKGVILNTLAPGLVDTDRNVHLKQQGSNAWTEYTKAANWMGRAGTPMEMIGAAIFLSSDACRFMTGEAIFLTGGC